MTDKEYFLDFWTPTLGAEDALKSWEAKEAQQRAYAPMVMGDIQPYVSMIDGSLIESRSKHRAHLKQHGCFEIGNETKYITQKKPLESPPGLKEELIRATHQVIERKRK